MKDTVYQIITDRIIELLEKGVVPWQKPWKSNELEPRNLVSKKAYRGINVWLLMAAGFESPYWVSFKQAKELGGTVKKGEKGFPVVFWNWITPKDSTDPKAKKIPFLRYYTVFNVSQCEGLKLAPTTEKTPETPFSPVEAAEAIVQNMPARPPIQYGKTRAAYCPTPDAVDMPDRERFSTPEDFYSVLFHELTHSTGHRSRLARKEIMEVAGFGSNPYAREELVAEMGAAFLCAVAGIVNRTVDNSAAYVANWLKSLKNDAKLVVQAAAQAQKAADFILGKSRQEETETETA